MIETGFWKNRNVFLTGHTGFKGSWLCLLLHTLGAKVTGYAWRPPTNPSLFEIGNVSSVTKTIIADVRDLEILKKRVKEAAPEVVIHLAAQALVRHSYTDPLETFSTNIMGSVHILEAVRNCPSVRVVINVTTDKCYENQEWVWSYRENDRLGGFDPYSSSKACAEMVTAAYRNSFFPPEAYRKTHRVAIATARAGNVIGGGDWAKDRLIPDCIRSAMNKKMLLIRNPDAVRPWQHVLEPLTGYLTLAEKLYAQGALFGESWNFGPPAEDAKPVAWIAKRISHEFGIPLKLSRDSSTKSLHETSTLRLDSAKAHLKLGWHPKWNLETAMDRTITWYKAFQSQRNMEDICHRHIEEHLSE